MKKAILYTKKLESTGLTRDQAEAHLEILEEIFDMEVATKQDIEKLEQKIGSSEERIMSEIRLIKNEVVLKLGALMCVAWVELLRSLNF